MAVNRHHDSSYSDGSTDAAETAPPIRPFDARMLAVGNGHWLYVEQCGKAGGRPCLFLHGGPGSGAQHAHRNLFDPERDHIILFDQRGAGRSHPYLSLTDNTTDALIADIELIRSHFGLERWLVVGGSWGSTLALAYAERHPERVAGLVIRAVFLGTRSEVEWAFVDGPRTFRPELYDAFAARLPPSEQDAPLASYVRRLTSNDARISAPAAHVWNAYERALSEIAPTDARLPDGSACDHDRLPPTPIVEAHYISNDFFLEPGQLLRNAERLRGIPGTIVQGRYDLLCPPRAAYALSQAWPDAKLILLDHAGHAMSEPGVADALRRAIANMS